MPLLHIARRICSLLDAGPIVQIIFVLRIINISSVFVSQLNNSVKIVQITPNIIISQAFPKIKNKIKLINRKTAKKSY
jgi:hypothetical protein